MEYFKAQELNGIMCPAKKRDIKVCPTCGRKVEPVKTWTLTSPLPDAKGRITVTVMGSFECPNCGIRWRGVISKLKIGGSEVEVEGKKLPTEPSKRENSGEVIELDMNSILSED